jgi:hypothetical protein
MGLRGPPINQDESWKIAVWACDKRGQILGLLSELRDWFSGGKKGAKGERPGILILGAGGSGKSTLGRILSGEFDLLLDPPGEYKESVSTEEYPLQDDPKTEVLVPSGQAHRRGATWTGLLADVVAGRFRGIILINAYGYHTLAQVSYKDTRIFQERGKRGFLRAYLEDSRSDEVAVLHRVAEATRSAPGKLWMLTLVCKQDLWWPNRSDVEACYRDGEYGAIIRDLQAHLGHVRFRHEYAFASLVISNFTTGMKETLRRNTAGYDQNLQVASLRRLFETVAALKQWEEDK